MSEAIEDIVDVALTPTRAVVSGAIDVFQPLLGEITGANAQREAIAAQSERVEQERSDALQAREEEQLQAQRDATQASNLAQGGRGRPAGRAQTAGRVPRTAVNTASSLGSVERDFLGL